MEIETTTEIKAPGVVIIIALLGGILFAICGGVFGIAVQLNKIEIAYAENPISREWIKTCPMDVVVQPGSTIIINEETE